MGVGDSEVWAGVSERTLIHQYGQGMQKEKQVPRKGTW